MTPVYGVTIDDCSNLTGIVQALMALPYRPTARIVFDWNKSKPEPTKNYLAALKAIHPIANIMGQFRDSDYEKPITVAQAEAQATSYLDAFAGMVNVWEIGNEVNGNWLGSSATVAAKIIATYNLVKEAQGKTALTLYLDDPKGTPPFTAAGPDGKAELTPVAFTTKYLTSIAGDIDYVYLSYYEQQFGNVRPTAAWWTSYFEALHLLYPNAQLGIGECGFVNKGGNNAVTTSTLAAATSMLDDYYGLKINLPYYCGGYHWWYWAENGAGPKALLTSQLHAAFAAEAAALT